MMSWNWQREKKSECKPCVEKDIKRDKGREGSVFVRICEPVGHVAILGEEKRVDGARPFKDGVVYPLSLRWEESLMSV